MKLLIALLLLGTVPFLYGCDSDSGDSIGCTTEFRYGVEVSIFDADTGKPIINAEVTGMVQDGSYLESLLHLESTNTLLGAGERPGTYTISISLPGYVEWKVSDVKVTSDECHVHTVRMDAFLTKAL